MLYLAEKQSNSEPVAAAAGVGEDEVDVCLAAHDGKIERKRDPQL